MNAPLLRYQTTNTHASAVRVEVCRCENRGRQYSSVISVEVEKSLL